MSGAWDYEQEDKAMAAELRAYDDVINGHAVSLMDGCDCKAAQHGMECRHLRTVQARWEAGEGMFADWRTPENIAEITAEYEAWKATK